jgi:hypothetical protein
VTDDSEDFRSLPRLPIPDLILVASFDEPASSSQLCKKYAARDRDPGMPGIPDTRDATERTALIEQPGKPGMIVSDNGTEFTSSHARLGAGEQRSLGTSSYQTIQNGFWRASMAGYGISFQ